MRLILIALMIFSASVSYAKINAYVSIIPQKFFVDKIGGDRVDVKVMVAPGSSPATYEPKPHQMVDMSHTEIYFSIGVPFENTWMNKLAALNPQMTVVHTDEGIKKRTMEAHHHDEDEDHHEHGEKEEHDEHDGIKDPHIWLDPVSVIKQAENITAALCKADSAGCSVYETNRDEFIKYAELQNSELERIFAGKKDIHFMVFHPSWGYFADRYHLEQIPVELEGKEPKPSDLIKFVERAKELKLKAIFVQPQFSTKAAELIAKETGAKVVAVDPLAYEWGKNLQYAAKLIAGSL